MEAKYDTIGIDYNLTRKADPYLFVTAIYEPGTLVVIPPNIPHSGKALTPCKLMDIFSPVRSEYK